MTAPRRAAPGVRAAVALALLAAGCASDGTTPDDTGAVTLGPGASLGGRLLFPADNPWNQRVDGWTVASDSRRILRSIGLGDHLHAET